MAGPCSTGAPASRWKRHIVRQLRQRDHTQKTLFLELVPACECSPGGLEDSRGGAGLRESICLASPTVTQVYQRLLPSEALGLLGSLLSYTPSPTSHILALSDPGSPWSPFLVGTHS